MATEVRVPVQGNDVESVVLVDFHVQVGDEVAAGQVLFSIETAKASFDVEAPVAGTVLATAGAPGDEVPVHTTVVVVGTADEAATFESPSSLPPQAGPAPVEVVTPAPAAAAADPVRDSDRGGASRRRGGASPRARTLAARHGIELAGIVGSGPHGRVIACDVIQHRRRAGEDAVQPAPAGAGGTSPQGRSAVLDAAAGPTPAVVPVQGVRRVVAERMVASLREAAQFTLSTTVDARPLQAVRARFKSSDERWGLRGVTVTDLVAFAAVRTLALHPALNAHFAWDGIRQFGSVALGLAVDTPRGLLVAVTRDADRLRLPELSARNRELATAARGGSLPPEHMSGSTFTVSSLGASGVEFFTPVLNPPEVAILGVGAIAPAVVRGAAGDGEIAPAVHLSLTVDHRAVDGAPAAAYLRDLALAVREIESLVAA